jgi:hypothetical protein
LTLLARLLRLASTLALAALLVGCGTDSSSSGGSSSGSGDEGPSFSLRLTDAVIEDVARVDITFTEVKLRKKSGAWVTIPKSRFATQDRIDLAALQGTKTADLLQKTTLEPGEYDELRLIVDTAQFANSIDLKTGGRHNLRIPSGGTSGLKIKGDFTVCPNYIMTPVLRLVSADNFGHVRGEIDPALLTAGSCSDPTADTFNAIYVYNGHNVSPDDINQTSNQNTDPVTTGKIAYDTAAAKYIYEAAFLPAGKYTIAFTCNSDKDDLEADDDLNFFGIQNVTVKLNNTTFL